ncbi:MAG: gamma-glutamyl-gamma-aminobutyrate hydrolase family protein, partial [Oxalobacter sp.]|nr:gamma-glutamyl-gamma-aminobutyrate hydrolase family protein [Oxalobacter sp.]
CRDAILQNIVPVLGICLGHQGICHLHGGHVDLAIHARHGRYSRITHDGTGLFEHIPSPFTAVRYHSLAVDRLPETLVATAHAEDGTIMAVSHRTLPQWGVQFHPESIGTAFGHRIFENFDTLTKEWNLRHDRSPFVASPPKPAISARSICRERTSLVLHHRRLSYELDSEYLFDTCFRHHPHAIWLDSNRNGYGSGRFSFMGCAGGTLGRIAKADIATRSIQITDSSGTHTVRHSLFEWLEEDLAKKRIPRDGIDIPFEFTLGWMGYIGYEMKADGTEERPHPSPYPDAILLFCDRGIVIDHQEKQIHLLALSEKNVTGNAVKWLDDMANRFRSF